ncbi:biopolymer transporter ExbD [Bermanella marisrubri]|uniref:Biopolymer transporter ExbD n=1 Tax=Bermanella marisrubri TaxID=207949 RepID=Q1MY73_9GAMM|nr:biopolymer transporter ExbD [Bermanella marisrubri]EAT10937.1 hypothetical protein RED65_02418 [Oceanobacter sp. RED65] [Bermanella marisrubri]QIZ83720.1 biopolymer transporter ExbD [Bermanella marisrubri]
MQSLIPTPLRNQRDDNLIPLINIVFLLLIFFMIAGHVRSPLVTTPSLPTSETLSKQPPASPDLQLEVSLQGQWYLNGETINETQLRKKLSKATATKAINLYADKDLQSLHLNSLLTLLRQSGFHHVNIVTEKVIH